MAQKRKYEFTDFSDNDNSGSDKTRAKKGKSAQQSKKATLTNQGVVFVEDYDDYSASTVSKKKRSKSKVGLVFTIALVITILVVLVVVISFMNVLNTNTVYDGVYINGVSVSGYTRQELTEYITDTYVTPLKDGKITVNIIDEIVEYSMSDFITLPDAVSLANQAYSIAREGSYITKYRKIEQLKTQPEELSIKYSINQDKFTQIVDIAYSKVFKELKHPEYTVKSSGVTFTYGVNGVNVNTEKLNSDITEAFSTLEKTLSSLGSGEAVPKINITVEAETIYFTPLNKDAILSEIYIAPTEPYYTGDAAGNFKVIAGTQGRSLDEDALTLLLARINGGEKIVYEELSFVELSPLQTPEQYEQELFRNFINNYTISNALSSDDPNIEFKAERQHNIELAASKLRDLTLMPGQTFSLLEFLGDISLEAGFIEAYENVQGEDTKVVGGGISMLATALYDALLLRNFTILEHHNFPYMPNFGLPALDAYVSQDRGYDLRFANNSTAPIRLSFVYFNDSVSVYIFGESTEPIKVPDNTSVSFAPVLSRTVNFSTQYVDDPTQPIGSEMITVPGIKGYVYILTLKNSKLDDFGNEILSTTQELGTVIYATRDRVILRGTMVLDFDIFDIEDLI